MKNLIVVIAVLGSLNSYGANKDAINSAIDASSDIVSDVSSVTAAKVTCAGLCFNIEIVGLDSNGKQAYAQLSTDKLNGESNFTSTILAHTRKH